jgi:hypothetical protein
MPTQRWAGLWAASNQESVSGFGCHAHPVGPSLSGNLEVNIGRNR